MSKSTLICHFSYQSHISYHVVSLHKKDWKKLSCKLKAQKGYREMTF